MYAEQKDMKVPSELVPKCPKCGKPMSMNLRADDTFVEDEGWHKACERYKKFLTQNKTKKILFLELGQEFFVAFTRLVPALVFHERIVRAQIHRHRLSAF
ncbi:hypothetical protein VPJ68_01285, partial [Parabacteroides distasonis]